MLKWYIDIWPSPTYCHRLSLSSGPAKLYVPQSKKSMVCEVGLSDVITIIIIVV